jgi:hypothetical protein
VRSRGKRGEDEREVKALLRAQEGRRPATVARIPASQLEVGPGGVGVYRSGEGGRGSGRHVRWRRSPRSASERWKRKRVRVFSCSLLLQSSLANIFLACWYGILNPPTTRVSIRYFEDVRDGRLRTALAVDVELLQLFRLEKILIVELWPFDQCSSSWACPLCFLGFASIGCSSFLLYALGC